MSKKRFLRENARISKAFYTHFPHSVNFVLWISTIIENLSFSDTASPKSVRRAILKAVFFLQTARFFQAHVFVFFTNLCNFAKSALDFSAFLYVFV